MAFAKEKSGQISPSTILANHLVLAIRGITFEWCIRYPDYNLREECIKHMDILLRGIGTQ
jgi:hypothetical protein